VRSHTKFGPDRFSRFDVYWIQTNRQTDKLNLYIDDIFICRYGKTPTQDQMKASGGFCPICQVNMVYLFSGGFCTICQVNRVYLFSGGFYPICQVNRVYLFS